MKIYYIANNRMPAERAYGVHIMKMCEAFSKNGIDLTLVLPNRRNAIQEDIFFYYGVEPVFKVKKLPVIDLLPWKISFAFLLETITFFISLFFYFIFKKDSGVIYVRGETILFLVKFLPKRFSVFWETHIKPLKPNRYKKAFFKSSGLIVANDYYLKELTGEYGLQNDKILLAPDGVDMKKFDIKINKKESREKLNLPLDKKIILYMGTDLKWKGLDILKEASDYLEQDCKVALVGSIKNESDKYKNIIFAGHKLYSEVPLWLKAADILILTGAAKSEISRFYTSPLKMFEYMASGSPIIAADMVSFREILDERMAFFYDPASPEDLAKKIKFVFANCGLAEQKAEVAFDKAKEYDWNKRAEKIIEFINTAYEGNKN